MVDCFLLWHRMDSMMGCMVWERGTTLPLGHRVGSMVWERGTTLFMGHRVGSMAWE